MRLRADGSIQPSSLPSWQNQTPRNDNNLYRGIVTNIKYVDDPNNITQNSENPEVTYDVVILGGLKAGQLVSNCRLSSDFGGNNNYYERTLPATSKKLNQTPLEKHDGAIVFFQFTQGHSGYPVITAIDGGTNTSGKTGALKADGPRLVKEYNGIYELINKTGDYTFIKKGGKVNTETGHFEATTAEAEYQYKRILEGTKDTVTYGNDKVVETTDAENEKKTISFKSGLNVNYDGKGDKATITTAGGAIIEVDGKGGKITLTKGSTVIELDGNGDKISLKGGFVDVGSSVSDFAVLFTELLTAFNTHTHIGNLAAPTSPPQAPLLQTVASTTVQLQP